MITNIMVSGIVQGVGFRYATKQRAEVLNLKGYATNNADGTVSIRVDGENEQIQRFITEITNNPTQFGRVDHIDVSTINTKEDYHGFSIK
ncbi:acylphosphatase [Virgibacillus necropolis]|uniref:acylphosphatase n=1 Tax=Virgibacillus necropolis TaxID=163877 RepID=A0A221MDB7_9BACI|nr:acylphosphatase [Virgibacillus necropolis]ASN05569.1 acylphosphatase [Virgibacillus necropolis]